jgi:hypothetical protein
LHLFLPSRTEQTQEPTFFSATPTPPINPPHTSPVFSTMATPTDPGGSSSISGDGKSFFEVLPRELRDRVYEYTFDHDIADGLYRYQFRAPHLHLRLVSRQFMHEYDEQTLDDATLFVTPCTDQFTYAYDYMYSRVTDRVPRLASRCTALDVSQYVGETNNFFDDINDEEYRVLSSLGERIGDLVLLIERLHRLRDVNIRFSLNFAQDFDRVYGYMEVYLNDYPYQYEQSNMDCSRLPNVTIELRHLDLNYSNLPSCLTPDVPGSDILKQPATLATFCYSYGCKEKKTKYQAVIDQRCHVEFAVLSAWEAQHGCTLSKSAKRATGIDYDESDEEGS